MGTSPPTVETGLLLRVEGGFALRCDGGGQVRLDVPRTPVDHVEKRVRITGTYIAEDLIEVESILPIDR